MPEKAKQSGIQPKKPGASTFAEPLRHGFMACVLASILLLAGTAAAEPCYDPCWEPCWEQGLLFRLEPALAEAQPSWLFATIHSDDARVTQLPAAVERAFDQAGQVVLELVPDAAMMETSRSMMLLAPEARLSALLPQPLYQELVRVLGGRGMPPAAVDRLQPWAALLVLSMPPASGQPVLDAVLYQRALQADKPIQGLETIEQQLAVFDALSLEDQVRLLEATLSQREQLPAIFTALVEAYLARDLGELMRLGRTLVAQDPALDARLRRALLVDRNQRMFQHLQPMLAEGACFVAVGALHLPGDHGLLQRLDRAGFDVVRVY